MTIQTNDTWAIKGEVVSKEEAFEILRSDLKKDESLKFWFGHDLLKHPDSISDHTIYYNITGSQNSEYWANRINKNNCGDEFLQEFIEYHAKN